MKPLHSIKAFLLVLTLQLLLLPQSVVAVDAVAGHLQDRAAKAEQLFSLGFRYDTADGVAQDYALAHQYYQEAVTLGSVQAMHNLGALYNWGYGVQPNRQMALMLWEQAADLGNMYSSFNMGNAFQKGDGRSKDTEKALYYYMLSYNQGYEKGICQYAEMLSGDRALNSENIRLLLQPLARQGNTQCLNALVTLLYEDYEQHQDSQSLLYWAEFGASLNSADAVFTLALLYNFGQKGISADAEKAKSYYLKAIELSHPSAYANLGFMYETGKFGKPDVIQAKYYYEQAVAIGSVWGFNNLASFYRNGIGKVIDFEKALSLYTQAAEMGNANAHRNIGIMYQFGQGVTPDAYRAEEYLLKAVELGYPQALLDLGLLHLDASLPLHDKTIALTYFYQAVEQDIAGALEILTEQFAGEEREWFVRSQISGQIAYDLASHYQAENNKTEACKWFLVAFKRLQDDAYLEVMPCVAEKHYSDMPYLDPLDVAREWAAHQEWDANSLIGELYYYGIGIKQDKLQAASYFLQSYEHSTDDVARFNLGKMYLAGDGVAKDLIKAKYFLELAAEQGISIAAYELGKLYRYGVGVAADENKALAYTRQAAEYIDHADSAFSYANMLFEGYGQEPDIRLAIDWYDRAIQLGHADASCRLGKVLSSHFANAEEQTRAEQLQQKCGK
ncbi:SEL1-like repeat protein [Rheinheimera muenzenbergensis]|uniref:SEL1-like repeat protein n=1 Tax=Rheinheimera muenzenbergensis TaxID=1193628 RepID=A0ABU8CBA0_9GAMM